MRTMYFCVMLCIFFSSCGQKNEKLENALKLAKENQKELEKVLAHYAQHPADALKLKAAEFLIENMPGHYTIQGTLINEYREKIYADTTASYFAKKALDISLSKIDWLRDASRKEEDIEHIKADFLIRHIDLSFERLNQYPWLEDYPFDLFLEYLLPYRFENERLDLWIDSLHVSRKTIEIHSLRNGYQYIKEFAESEKTFDLSFIRQLFGRQIYVDCSHASIKYNFKLRALGFPSTIEYIVHFANRNGYHNWCKPISAEYKEYEDIGISGKKTAKVYQKTYSRNKTLIPHEGEYLPEMFRDPFLKDISSQYLHTENIRVHVNNSSHTMPHYAFLCVFNNLEWQPTAIGKVKRKKAEFKDIGKDIAYLPVCFDKQNRTIINYPFILNLKGEVEYLIPDTSTRQVIRIKRKYPLNENLLSYARELERITFEGSNDPELQESDTLLTNLETSEITYLFGEIKTRKLYRHYRITSPISTNIGEIILISSRGERLKGTTDSIFTKGFDHNPLTNTRVKKDEAVNIRFDSPVEIAKIICLPRSDGNGIYPENEYELFYHDLNGWQSLGRKTATDYYLEYDNIPKDALLWLRNRTTGIEERIFTYQDQKIKFW
ncbi:MULTISPECIES: hypothetical protein [Sanguibacteroides]|nr:MULTISPECIES: hypothetical protein [Sanguibacteroides]